MSNALIQLGIFIVIGLVWRYFKPGGVDADSLRHSILSLIHWIFLPLLVFFTLSVLKFNKPVFQYSLYAIIASLVGLAVAWFWLSRTNLESKSKGALILAACFGSVLFIGLPLTRELVAPWSARVSVMYLLVVNVLVLYTVGVFLARAMAKPIMLKKPLSAFTDEGKTIIKEPLVIAALLGILMNIIASNSGFQFPAWLGGLNGLALGALIPLLALTLGLSLTWDQRWMQQLNTLAPVAGIKLILIPLVLLILVKLFGTPGVQTTKSLMINGMMPTALLGLVVCDRFKFDTKTYAMAFSVTSILALVAVPIWLKFI